MDEQEKLAQATRQVEAIEGFYIHLAAFVLVTATLFTINLATSPDWWAQWVFLGWGIGVLAHALVVFGHTSRLVADWRARKIAQIMAKL
jgi:hypothetical protein